MALIKDFSTPLGVTANYHKIVKAEITASNESVLLMVAIYASAAARDAGAQAMWHEYVTIPFSDLTQDPRDLLYPMLKHFNASYLVGAEADEEGSGSPGNFQINLKPEVIVQPPEEPVEE